MSSKRGVRRARTAGTVRHATAADAAQARAALREISRPVDVYRCEFCGNFHVGHRPGKRLHRPTG